MASTFTVDLQRFPLPGTSRLYALDSVTILQTILPLARPIEAATEMDVEKRKAPGTDYSTYVSHGLDSSPIRITLKLWRDLASGKDWVSEYLSIKDRLIQRNLSKRNAVPVYHPFLNIEGINEIVFTKRSCLKQERGLIFTVDLEGFNPKTLRIGSGASPRIQQDLFLTARGVELPGGKSKSVDVDKQNANRQSARQRPVNVVTPSQNQVGRAFPRGQ